MAKAFFADGFDAIAWNFRGCSGEVNRQRRFYHSGATDDLQTVIHYAAKDYDELYLIGFSLGGNLTLKYLGEATPIAKIKKAVVFSVPMNLHTSCLQISSPGNWIYVNRFLSSLKKKVKEKAALRNDLNIDGLEKIQTLIEFDDHFTGPVHGFRDAVDYYTQCSSLYFVAGIRVPTLVVNALNDPFLSEDCYPGSGFKNSFVQYEFPNRGGHVGFAMFDQKGLYWSEMRALSFIEEW
jgi:predicted alpha/beta-fold hydrolase